jgi:hypothetical protein
MYELVPAHVSIKNEPPVFLALHPTIDPKKSTDTAKYDRMSHADTTTLTFAGQVSVDCLQNPHAVDHAQLAFFGFIMDVMRRAMISTEPMQE